MKITFLNHACVKIESEGVAILCDPWLNGSAFNDGWDLLVPTPWDTKAIMEGVTHIWISHEHPDHFSPAFFKDIANWRETITVLFQKTRDHRVRDALVKRGFKVEEIASNCTVNLGSNVSIRIGPNDFYDSWLWVGDGKTSILNANDCVLYDKASLSALKQIVGQPDVLLTQFSYAAWKGGRDKAVLRKLAAQEKLRNVATQIAILGPHYVIPFASMIYFSNVENCYMNDHVNTPRVMDGAITEAGSNPIILYPGDDWNIGSPHDNTSAIRRYDIVYDKRDNWALRGPGASVSALELEKLFGAYRDRILQKNWRSLIAILRHVPVLRAFRPIDIYLTDLDTGIRLSVLDGFNAVPKQQCDISMHSSSLAFILKNEFGYDTLTVNGRFEATPEGFSRMTRSFSIGSLNALGLSISPALILKLHVVAILLRRLLGLIRRLKTADAKTPASASL